MEYVDGITLEDLLESEKRLGWRRSLAIARQVAEALAASHAGGVVHRDLKPANVFLVDSGLRNLVKVADFGLARQLEPGAQALTGLGKTFTNGALRAQVMERQRQLAASSRQYRAFIVVGVACSLLDAAKSQEESLKIWQDLGRHFTRWKLYSGALPIGMLPWLINVEDQCHHLQENSKAQLLTAAELHGLRWLIVTTMYFVRAWHNYQMCDIIDMQPAVTRLKQR